MLTAEQAAESAGIKELEEDEERTATLICSVLSALQNLGKRLEISKVCCLFVDYITGLVLF